MTKTAQTGKKPGILIGYLLVGVGLVGGYLIAILPIRDLAKSFYNTTGLSTVLWDTTPQEVSTAYLEPSQMLSNFDKILWSAPQAFTSFVGSAPLPQDSASLSIDRYQLRSSRPFESSKKPGTFRIFITGGSSAFGSGAPSNASTIGGHLESILKNDGRPVEVYTAANVAWSSTHERIFVENRISEWNPDLVISLSGANGCHWGIRGRNSLWFETYSDQFFRALMNRALSSALLPSYPDMSEISESSVSPQVVATRMSKNARLASYSLHGQGNYVLALQPLLATTKKPLSKRESSRTIGFGQNEKVSPAWAKPEEYFKECFSEIRKTFSSSGTERVAFRDLTDVFDQYSASDEIFIDNYHFGDRGNQIIATRLAKHVNEFFPKQ